MGGAQTLKKALKQAKDSAAMCESAGMQLLKWQTNSAELRALVDPTSSGAASSGVLSEMIAGEAATKALGVQWETNDDSFVFNPQTIIKAAVKLLPTPN